MDRGKEDDWWKRKDFYRQDHCFGGVLEDGHTGA